MLTTLFGVCFGVMMVSENRGEGWYRPLPQIGLIFAFFGIVVLGVKDGFNDGSSVGNTSVDSFQELDEAEDDEEPDTEDLDADSEDIEFILDDCDDVTYVKKVMERDYEPKDDGLFYCQLCWIHAGRVASFRKRSHLVSHFLTRRDGHYQAVIGVGEQSFSGHYLFLFQRLMANRTVRSYLRRQSHSD